MCPKVFDFCGILKNNHDLKNLNIWVMIKIALGWNFVFCIRVPRKILQLSNKPGKYGFIMEMLTDSSKRYCNILNLIYRKFSIMFFPSQSFGEWKLKKKRFSATTVIDENVRNLWADTLGHPWIRSKAWINCCPIRSPC